MLTLLLILLTVYAWWAPDSWLGKAMGRLTARLVHRLGSIRPLTMVCFMAAVAIFAGLIAYGKIEGLIMVGLAAPETFMMFLAIDVGTAVELLVIAWLAASRGNLGVLVRHVRAIGTMAARWRGGRARRARRPQRKPARPANDDDPMPAILQLRLARAA